MSINVYLAQVRTKSRILTRKKKFAKKVLLKEKFTIHFLYLAKCPSYFFPHNKTQGCSHQNPVSQKGLRSSQDKALVQ